MHGTETGCYAYGPLTDRLSQGGAVRRSLLLVLEGFLILVPSAAAIAQESGGFTVKHEVTIAAAPSKVYEASVKQVGKWWNPEHTYTGNSKNLSIDPRPGGCFCETFPEGGGIEHLRVIYVSPGKVIRMSGALGPLQELGVAGSLTWSLAPEGEGTKVTWTYAVGGFMDGGFGPVTPAVEGVLGEQLARLKSFAETGKPTS